MISYNVAVIVVVAAAADVAADADAMDEVPAERIHWMPNLLECSGEWSGWSIGY